jgi:hypothetical protein
MSSINKSSSSNSISAASSVPELTQNPLPASRSKARPLQEALRMLQPRLRLALSSALSDAPDSLLSQIVLCHPLFPKLQTNDSSKLGSIVGVVFAELRENSQDFLLEHLQRLLESNQDFLNELSAYR